MTRATFMLELRLRGRLAALASIGVLALTAVVGALYPALGHSIGNLNLPKGVSGLLGGGNLGTLAGWLRTEIVATYGPLIVAAVAITCAAATTAGEEESRILALVLAHPVKRSRLLLAKAAGIAVIVVLLALTTWIGLLLAVALAGGRIGAGDLAAQSVHLALMGLALGALALAIGATSGQRSITSGAAAALAALMFLVNGLAPSISAISWLKYLTVFHYYSGHDPLTNGVHLSDVAVLAAVTGALTAAAVNGLRRRDLRA